MKLRSCHKNDRIVAQLVIFEMRVLSQKVSIRFLAESSI